MNECMEAFTISDVMASALDKHAMNNHLRIAWEEAEVLASNQRPDQHCPIEAWHIRSQPLPMNREAGLFPTAYDILINRSPANPLNCPVFHVRIHVLSVYCNHIPPT